MRGEEAGVIIPSKLKMVPYDPPVPEKLNGSKPNVKSKVVVLEALRCCASEVWLEK
jgi:hypothetical protein